MTKETLIETVKKLLALASSPNEHEAQLAMKRAQDLIARYSISVMLDANEPIIETSFKYSSLCYMSQEMGAQIVHVITPIFGVQSMRKPSNFTLHLFGYKTNVQLAIHGCYCIINQLNAELKKVLKKTPGFVGPNFIHDYWLAAAREIERKFEEPKTIGQGLVVYDKAKELMHRLYNIRPLAGIAFAGTAGIELGAKAGREAQLRSGVEKRSDEVKRIG